MNPQTHSPAAPSHRWISDVQQCPSAADVLHRFADVCAIPHPTHYVEALGAFIMDQAKALGLDAERDAVGNVLVCKPASAGRDHRAGVVLQAHIDMVPQVAEGVAHDWLTDPIEVHRVAAGQDAEWPGAELLEALGTSLGADNGIGVAAMLAIMADEGLEHGPLELLFTIDEEAGMEGASALPTGWLTGRYLINLDAERHGQLMTGCAGAVDMVASFGYRMDSDVPEGDRAVRLRIGGLQGGHSGMDIHLGRGNAIKMMCRLLKHLVVHYEARVATLSGGTLRNAIPREAEAVVTVPGETLPELMDEVAYYQDLFRYELRVADPAVTLSATETSLPAELMPEEVQDDILNAIEAVHDGVLRIVPGQQVVETSSNLASVETGGGETRVCLLVRSMNEEMKRALASQLQSAFLLAGARVDFANAYRGWELPSDAPLLHEAVATFAGLFGHEPEVTSVHCGLECGVIGGVAPSLQMLSIGPTIHHPHSPRESVETASVDAFYRYLVALLRQL